MLSSTILQLPLFAVLTSLPQLASGHTWVEQANRISPNGTLVGPAGFPPKWAGRAAPGFSDLEVTNRVGPSNTNLCAKQPIGQQIDGFPALTAAPGDFIALRYTENGHVSKPEPRRPLNGGTIYVYGTSDPRPNENVVDVHRKWTADGQGGDKRGRLLATRNYDDGQCFESNGMPISNERQGQFPKAVEQPYGPNLWCQTDVQIPDDVPKGSPYVVYWVWNWPQLQDNAGSENGLYLDFPAGRAPAGGEHLASPGVFEDQLYTSCLEVKVEGEPLVKSEPNADGSLGTTTSKFAMNRFIDNREDWNEAAVRGQLENQFQVNVDNMPKPEGGAAPGAPGAPSAPVPAPAPTPTTPANGGAPPNDAPGGIRTVTVTAAPTTVYATATVTAGAPGLPVRSVEPFMKARRSNWAFGRD
ncbi:hypothetical protein B0T11DRAFT_323663 [Plectosphaerella cucumerina]|uniref:DUF7492 domain-containing protein n=1 Tax=Plectosphaerella cucumerina TaxID=40658 RepID=A0A8K0X8S4_9PEZI|nr:hypothetical protein B0T11DRAFT_323663 [Plectosphaerella cucumerina]